MKKIISTVSLIICLVCASACKNLSNSNVDTKVRGSFTNMIEIAPIVHDDEIHEYIVVHSGLDGSIVSLSHWEGCKYCKDEK